MTLADYARKQPVGDFAAILGPGIIRQLLMILWDSYQDLLSKGIVTKTMDEDQITEELYRCIYHRIRPLNLPVIPTHQKGDSSKAKKIGKKPTIDFCFSSDWDKDSYFGAECKILDIKFNRLFKEYIENGIKRYFEGIYGSKSSTGAMIAYIRQGEIKTVANKIELISLTIPDSQLTLQEEITYPIGHYVSNNKRALGLSSFLIHHLLFSFFS